MWAIKKSHEQRKHVHTCTRTRYHCDVTLSRGNPVHEHDSDPEHTHLLALSVDLQVVTVTDKMATIKNPLANEGKERLDQPPAAALFAASLYPLEDDV